MKLENYITHLELQKRGLKLKYEKIVLDTEKKPKRGQKDPLYNEKSELRLRIKNLSKEIAFFKNLKEAMDEKTICNKRY